LLNIEINSFSALNIKVKTEARFISAADSKLNSEVVVHVKSHNIAAVGNISGSIVLFSLRA